MPLVLRAMLLALLACWTLPACRPGERAGDQSARHRFAGLGCRFGGPRPCLPHRPAAAARDRLAHLLAEPRRRRHPAGAAPRPAAGGHRRPDRLADAPARARRVADDLLLHRQRAAAGDRHALRRRRQHQGACRLAGVPRHLRAGGRRFPARPAGGERLALAAGAAVRRVRPAGPATLALARGGRRRRHAVRPGPRADPRHRGGRLVHPRGPRHDPATVPRSR